MAKKIFAFALLSVLAAYPLFAQNANANGQEEKCAPEEEAAKNKKTYKVEVGIPLTVLDLVFTNKRGDILSVAFDGKEAAQRALEVKENGEPQTIEFFEPTDAELTVLLLVDYSRQAVIWSAYSQGEVWTGPLYLIKELKESDWIGMMLYDMNTEIWLDFTRNKTEAEDAVGRLWQTSPGFSESNLADAVWDVLNIAERQEKHRFVVVLLSTGFDTFSKKLFFDSVLPRVKNSRAVFYPIGIGGNLRARGYESMDNLEADSRLKELARATGGKAYFPRFVSEFPEIFQEIAARLRKQYTVGYYPTNRNFDGKRRKIGVRLNREFEEALKMQNDINGDGKIDKKDQKEKIIIHHKEEYYPGKEFE